MYSNVFVIYELSSARQQCDVSNQVELLPCVARQNSINLVRHGSSTTFETGLR